MENEESQFDKKVYTTKKFERQVKYKVKPIFLCAPRLTGEEIGSTEYGTESAKVCTEKASPLIPPATRWKRNMWLRKTLLITLG